MRKTGRKDLQDSIVSLREQFNDFKSAYHFSYEQLFALINSQDLIIPTSIFNSQLGCLETVVKFAIEHSNYSKAQVAQLLGRTSKNIWAAYSTATKKHPSKLKVKSTDYFVLASVLNNRQLSTLESIVHYLKTTFSLTYREIGDLIDRDERTIWKTMQNALKKIEHEK